jgi:hypothetical protein
MQVCLYSYHLEFLFTTIYLGIYPFMYIIGEYAGNIYIYIYTHTKSTQNSSLFLRSHMVPTKLYYYVARPYQAWKAHSPASTRNCTTTRPSRPVALTQLFILTSLRKRKMYAALRGIKPQFLRRPPPPPSAPYSRL